MAAIISISVTLMKRLFINRRLPDILRRNRKRWVCVFGCIVLVRIWKHGRIYRIDNSQGVAKVIEDWRNVNYAIAEPLILQTNTDNDYTNGASMMSRKKLQVGVDGREPRFGGVGCVVYTCCLSINVENGHTPTPSTGQIFRNQRCTKYLLS